MWFKSEKTSSSNATEVSLLFLYHACGLLPCGRNTGTCRALVSPVLCQQFLERSTLPSTCSCGEVSLDDIEHGFLRARPDYFEAIWKIVKIYQNILCMNFDLPTVLYYWWDMYGYVWYCNQERPTKETQFSSRFRTFQVLATWSVATKRFCIQHIKTNISNFSSIFKIPGHSCPKL